MKKILIVISCVFAALQAMAQGYAPTSTWPYLYADFQDGTLYMRQGTKIIQKLNVHVAHARLHYLDNGTIKQLNLSDVVALNIGDDRYVIQEGMVYRVEASDGNGLILRLELGDFNSLNETGGAYGASSTSSATNKLATIAYDAQVNQNVMLVLQSRNEGVELNIKKTLFFKTQEGLVKASAKEVEKFVGAERKAAWKAWQKAHKVKWNDPQSLVEVFDFLSE